ncbi:MAG: hypothetical protein ACSLFQ_14660 [Thermoanaerobaculia bacterium]
MRLLRYLLLALLSALPVLGAQLVAPRPVILGPVNHPDLNPVSISNGETTLVAWENHFSPYWTTHRIFVRNLDRPGSAWSIYPGFGPVLATNGREYLLAFSRVGSRFISAPVNNVIVQSVSAEGEAGAQQVLNRSLEGRARAAQWDGERWVVGYTSDGNAFVAWLDEDLQRVGFAEAGEGHLLDLEMIDGRVWAFVTRNGETEALELFSDGTRGVRHLLVNAVPTHLVDLVGTTGGALLLGNREGGVGVIHFHPVSGFGSENEIGAGAHLADAIPSNGGAAILLVDDDGAVIVDLGPDGELGSMNRLNGSRAVYLGEWAEGLLYFELRADEDDNPWTAGSNIYAYRLAGRTLHEPAELISIANIASQITPAIVSTGENAVAFWTEQMQSPEGIVRSRAIDASGNPFGPIATLASIPHIDDLAFDGQRIFAVWTSLSRSIYAAAISRDGATANAPALIGEGDSPAVASNGGATFVVWRSPSSILTGTALREDGSPVVPGGFPLLPAFGEMVFPAKITPFASGFLVGWIAPVGMRNIVLSREGTVMRGNDVGGEGDRLVDVGSGSSSALALVSAENRALLLAFDGDGRFFDRFDPHWGASIPHSIVPLGGDHYLIAIARGSDLYTSEVTMSGAFITGVTPLRRLGPAEVWTAVEGAPLGLYIDEEGVQATKGPEVSRRRIVVRR